MEYNADPFRKWSQKKFLQAAEHNKAEEAPCSRWFTIRGPLFVTFAYYSFTSLPSHLEARFAFTAQKLQCFQSYPRCLYSFAWFCLFVKQVGTRAHLYWASVSVGAKNSFAMDCRFISTNWLKDLCYLQNSFVLFCRIITNIYGNSSKSALCFGRQQYHLCVAVQL